MVASSSKKLRSVQNPKSIIGSWIFTVLWCGISFPLFWAFAIRARDVFGGSIGGLFSLIGLALLYGSLKMTLEYFKYGAVNLLLEGPPPATGASFSAKLELPADAAAAGKVSAELACVRVTWSRGSKGGTSKGERDAWTGKREFPVYRGAMGGHASLRLEVPADQPGSDVPGEGAPDTVLEVGHPAGIEIGRDYHRWELRVKADVPGIDLERTFKLQVASAKLAASATPAAAPPRFPPALDPAFERRLDAQKAVERKLGRVAALIGFVPFVAPFAIMGLAVGLAGCPMGWSASQAPSCEFAGINWGPLMAGAFDLMPIAVPAGIAGSAIFYFAGRIWLDRRHQTNSFGSSGGLVIGLIVLGFFLYQAWRFMRPIPSAPPAAPQAQQSTPAGNAASSAGRRE